MDYSQDKEFVDAFQSTLSKLHSIWDDIGVEESEQKQREVKLMQYIKTTFQKVIDGEVEMKNGIIKSVKKNYMEYSYLCRELDMKQTVGDVDNVSLLYLDHNLKLKLTELQSEVKRRQNILKDLVKQDQELCERLIEDPSPCEKAVPSLKDITDMENKINTLKIEMKYREQSFKNLKTKISKLYTELDISPNTSFERGIFSSIEDLFTLSQQNLKDMKKLSDNLENKIVENETESIQLQDDIEKLWKRLDIEEEQQAEFLQTLPDKLTAKIKLLQFEKQRLEDIKLSNLACYINRTKLELEEWWDKCYVSEEERNDFKPYFEDMCSEEIFTAHEDEVEKLKKVYKNAEKLYTRLEKRQNLWNKFMELDSNINNPDRLFGNRGCSLLQEEKERKKINNELPKIESELENLTEQWEEDNGKSFLVNGMPLLEYFKDQWNNYNNRKQKEKINRKVAKVNQLEYESRLGSVPRGAKRKIINRSETLRGAKHMKLSESIKPPSNCGSVLSSTKSSSVKSFMSSTLALSNEVSYTPRSYPTRSVLKEQSFNTPQTRTPATRRASLKNNTFLKTDTSVNFGVTPKRNHTMRENVRYNASKTPFVAHPPSAKKSMVTPAKSMPPKIIPKTAPVMRRRSARLTNRRHTPVLSPITASSPRVWNSTMNKTSRTPKMSGSRNKLNFLM